MIKMFAHPIAVNVASAPDNFQLESLGLQPDIELKQLLKVKTYLNFGVEFQTENIPT